MEQLQRVQGQSGRFKFRTGDVGLRERGRRFSKVDGDDDKLTSSCECDSECEDRVHVVSCRPSVLGKREKMCMTQLGKVEGSYRVEVLEAWNGREKTVALLGHKEVG